MFDTKAEVLRLVTAGTSPVVYSWKSIRSVWLHGEETGRTNIFTKTGIGTAGTRFALYRLGDITLANALLWRGKHYFLTSAEQQTAVTAEINSAKVEIKNCVATRPEKQNDKNGRPKNVQNPLADFPAVLTEKYTAATHELPQTVIETTMILVTPKAVVLRSGDLVTTEAVTYAVLLCHLQGEWANEYEIVNISEA